MHKELELPPLDKAVGMVPARISRFRAMHRRALIVLALVACLAAFLAWLPPGSRVTLLRTLLHDRLLVTLLVLFSLLALSLIWSFGQQIDAQVFEYFNLRGYHPPWMDRLMWLVTQIGNMGFAAALAALSYEFGDTRFAVLLMLGVLSLWLFVEAVKALADRARPFRLIEGARVVGWRERGKSFPSGHTSQAFFVVSLLVHHLDVAPPAAVLLYVVGAFVGLTRMYVGAHYPRDVLAGALLGSVWGILSSLVPPYG